MISGKRNADAFLFLRKSKQSGICYSRIQLNMLAARRNPKRNSPWLDKGAGTLKFSPVFVDWRRVKLEKEGSSDVSTHTETWTDRVYLRLRFHERGFTSIRFHDFETVSMSLH